MTVAPLYGGGVEFGAWQIMQEIEQELFPSWFLQAGDPAFMLYPFVSRSLNASGGYTAQMYQDGEYREVYWDDTLAGISFFGLGQKIDVQGTQERADVHLVVFADTAALFKSPGFRGEIQIRNAFANFFRGARYGYELQSIETGLSNVLRDYPASRRDERLIAADTGTVHAFRLNFNVFYDRDASVDPFGPVAP